ncbi:MAG: RHS repeat-associated core domain-containing protein [Flavobacteriales bacterium]
MRLLILTFIGILLAPWVYGQPNIPNIVADYQVYQYTGGSVLLGNVTDPNYTAISSGTANFRDKQADLLVSLFIDPDDNVCYEGYRKITVDLEVKYRTVNPFGSPSAILTDNITLEVYKYPDLRSEDRERAFKVYKDAYWSEVRVTAVNAEDETGTPVTVSDIPEDVKVELQLQRTRYYNQNPLQLATTFVNLGTAYTNTFRDQHNVFVVEWVPLSWASEYELEWTYVDNFAGSGGLGAEIAMASLPLRFRNNSSRVRVPGSQNRFHVPLIYSRGYVCVRVRPLTKGGPNLDKDLFGNWSFDPSNSGSFMVSSIPAQCRYKIDLFNGSLINNLNAQYETTFSEDGKILPQGTYADGSMRIRQDNMAVTVSSGSINDYNKLGVVVENIYDFLGRAAITTLPGVTEPGFWYKADYNQDMSGNKYSYLNFDFDTPVDGKCYSESQGMGTTRGASMYYSPQNPDQNGAQSRLADARNFPFTRIIYEADNASRPKMRSGAGIDHRIGSGHETQFIYGNPSQDDLNRLFGTDAGYAGYYQKSMVIDANGQVNITYTDMEGRTVATSLAGRSPRSMTPLEDENGELQDQGVEVVEDQLEVTADNPHGNQNLPNAEGDGYTVNRFLLVTSTKEYLIDYKMNAEDFSDECVPDFCADCIYDLEISLLDECGNYVVGNDNLDGPMIVRIPGAEINNECDGENGYDYSVNVELDAGLYNLVKKLTVANDAMESYLDSIMKKNVCLKDLDFFYEMPDVSDCYITCETCLDALGTLNDFVAANEAELGGVTQATMAYNDLKEQCESLCAESYKDECTLGYEMLLQDVSPLGQYGMHDAGDPSPYELSVFNLSNELPRRGNIQFNNPFSGGSQAGSGIFSSLPAATWRNPKYRDPISNTWVNGYYDDYGNRARVILGTNSDGDLEPAFMVGVIPMVDGVTGDLYIYPEQLLNTSDFLALWQNSYARSLVVYHPEYFKYEFCSEAFGYTVNMDNGSGTGVDVNTYEYANLLEKYTAAQAIAELGLTMPISTTALITALVNNDPFFSNASSYAYGNLLGSSPVLTARDLFLSKLNNYQFNPSVPLLLNIVKAAYANVHCGINAPLSCLTTGMPTTIDLSNPAIQPDQVWRQIAILYATARQQSMAVSMHVFPITKRAGVYTDCIGGGSYTFPFWFTGVTFAGVPANPCNIFDFYRYSSKQERYPTFSSLLEQAGFNDPPSASEFDEYAAQSGSAASGKCPMQIDFENLVGTLAMNGKLTASGLVDLNSAGYMGSTLYDYLVAAGNGFNANIIVSPSTVQIIIAGNCTTTLSWPGGAPAGFDWSDVYFATDVHNGPGGPSLYGYIQNGYPTYVEIPFTTCLSLTGCTITPQAVCKPTQDIKDLHALMNALSANGDLWSTSAIALTAYAPVLTTNLKSILGSGPASSYTWKFTGGVSPKFELSFGAAVITISINTGTSTLTVPPSLPQTLTSIYQSPATTPTPTNISTFSFGSVETTNATPFFIAPGTPELILNGSLSVVNGLRDLYASSCEMLPDPRCNTQEHKNLENLKDRLRQAQESNMYNELVQEMGTCFTWPQTYTDGNAIVTGNIISINSVTAIMSLSQNGGESTHFAKVNVSLSGGGQASFIVESCNAFKNCDPCNEADTCLKILTAFDFGDYIEKYGPGNVPHGNYIISFTGECTMFPPHSFVLDSSYTDFYDFLNAWAAELNSLYGASYGIYAFVQGDYLVIEKDRAFMPPNCRCETYRPSLSYNRTRILTGSMNCCSMLDTPPVVQHRMAAEAEDGWQVVVKPFDYEIDCYEPVTPFPTDTIEDPCISYLLELAAENAWNDYQAYLDSVRNAYRLAYTAKCMQALESFKVHYSSDEYHYTLYYYDLAGNLVRTVPPHAVTLIGYSDMAAVNSARSAGTEFKPEHNDIAAGNDKYALTTRYRYNVLNQTVIQTSADGGQQLMFYDNLGRLIVTKTPLHSKAEYSYTRFDALGRTVEIGEMKRSDALVASLAFLHNPSNASTFLGSGYVKSEFIRTYYDAAPTGAGFYPASFFSQDNLRKRTAYMTYQPGSGYAVNNASFENATYFDYDYHGNIRQVLQDNKGMPDSDPSDFLYNFRFHRIEYRYDLISGRTTEMVLNRGRQDQFWQRYDHDEQNRMIRSSSSADSYWFDTDAEYDYFYHGELARVEYGPYKSQGNDYTFTLHGWLKGINSEQLDPKRDPGQDGYSSSANQFTGRDVYGLGLTYYQDDYVSIAGSADHLLSVPPAYYNGYDLYNGNVRAADNTLKLFNGNSEALLQVFAYDQLSRITESHAWIQEAHYPHIDNWDPGAPQTNMFATAYRYDLGGNMQRLNRFDKTATQFDELRYTYQPGSNMLTSVSDAVPDPVVNYDVDNQDGGNYKYDQMGNLVYDKAEEIASIAWNAFGKVLSVKRIAGSARPDLYFDYNSAGYRIAKTVVMPGGETWKEFYILDALGNTLGIYRGDELSESGSPAKLKLEENVMYGTLRLGTWERDKKLSFTAQAPQNGSLLRGTKRYEMSNQLTNVQALVTDRKKLVCEGEQPSYYEAEVTNLYDYYAFGMLINERVYTASYCDTLVDSVRVTVFDTDFNSEIPAWSIFDTGHTWYHYGDSLTRTAGGRLKLTKYYYDYMNSAAYVILDAGPSMPELDGNTTYYYEFDIDMGNCGGLDSMYFWVDDLNGNDMIYQQNVMSGGHFSGSFTTTVQDEYQIFFILYGDTCTAYLDNFLLWTYADSSSIVCGDSIGAGYYKYRYGYNGQERDDEMKGPGNSLNYTFRMYDPRIARFFAVDPLTDKFAELSPYQFAANSPIVNVELEGLQGDPSFFGDRIYGLGIITNFKFSKFQLTGGIRQDIRPLQGVDIDPYKNMFGITPRMEIKATADFLPSFNFRVNFTATANMNIPNGTIGGNFSLTMGTDMDAQAKLMGTSSGKGSTDKAIANQKLMMAKKIVPVEFTPPSPVAPKDDPVWPKIKAVMGGYPPLVKPITPPASGKTPVLFLKGLPMPPSANNGGFGGMTPGGMGFPTAPSLNYTLPGFNFQPTTLPALAPRTLNFQLTTPNLLTTPSFGTGYRPLMFKSGFSTTTGSGSSSSGTTGNAGTTAPGVGTGTGAGTGTGTGTGGNSGAPAQGGQIGPLQQDGSF